MKNNNIVAAAEIEAARNLKIYNELAKIAREVFTHINAETGKIYTPADIARAIVGGPIVTCVNGLNYRCDRVEKYTIGNGLHFADDYSPETVYDVKIDGFSCRVNGWKIFNVLDRAARAWDIASAARVTFEKPYETAARVVSFSLSAAAARELAACCANDVLRPVMNGVHLDTRRRCLVASNGHVLRVLQMGAALTVDESAAASSYIIPADVLKSGRVVTIDANGIVSTDKKSAPAIAGRYPNYLSVIPGASGRIDITADQWKQIKKAVADVAKVHDKKDSYNRVTIAHETASDKLIIHAFNYDFNRERETAVSIDTAAPAFSLSFNADYFAKIAGTPTALYIKDNSRALVAVDGSGLSLIMPLLQPSDDKYYINFNFAESYGDYLPGLNITAAAAEIKEENEAAAAAEIVAKVREECKGKSTKSMLKYINDNFGWSSALQRARDILTAEIESEKNAAAPAAADIETRETPAAPAADIESTTANDTTAPAIVANDNTAAPAADIETSETPAAVPSIESTTANDGAPAVLSPVAFVDVCETAANDDTAAPGFAAAPVPVAAPLHFWHPANDDTRRPAVVLDIETGDTPANDETTAHGQINAVFRYLLRAAAVVAALLLLTFANDRPTIATARPAAADIETPAAVPSIESTTANDGAPAVLVPVANDDTAAPAAADIESTTANDDTPRHRSTRPRRRAVSSAKVAAPAADIESTTARDTTANDDTARALLLTVTNDTTANDTARAIVAAPTLYEAGEITETSDTAAAVVPAAADIESTTANDDTQTAATAADIETSDTAAPSIESTTANDDTANDDTANDGAPATTGTTTPAAPAAGCPAAVATPCPPAAPVAPVAPILL